MCIILERGMSLLKKNFCFLFFLLHQLSFIRLGLVLYFIYTENISMIHSLSEVIF